MIIASNIAELLKELGDVKLLAASKQQSIEKIQEAIKAGIYRFGENYLQEAIDKINALNNKVNHQINNQTKNQISNHIIEWHFIGHIQSNKTSEIAQYFDWAHSLDRKKIATRLNNQRPAELPPLNICIEINLSQDPHKSGVTIDELMDLISHIQTLQRLKWRGLMTMITQDYQKASEIFHDLQKQGYDIDTLSMGMSQDYQEAVRLGATMIRLGTRIFGERKTP